MALKDDALNALMDAGNNVKAGLWREDDGTFLEDCAAKLAEFQLDAAATSDADLRDQYREAAQLQIQRLEAIMLERANAVGNQALEDACKMALQIALKAVVGLLLA
jgi:hypothetical protein